MEQDDTEDLTGVPRFRRASPSVTSTTSSPAPLLLVRCPEGQRIVLDLEDLRGRLDEVSLDLATPQNSAVPTSLGRIGWSLLLTDGPPSSDPSPVAAGLSADAWSGALFLQALVVADALLDSGFAEVGGIAERLALAAVDGALARAGSPFPPSLQEWLVLHRRLDPLHARWIEVHELALNAERRHAAGTDVRLVGKLRPVAARGAFRTVEDRRSRSESDLLCEAHWAEDVAAASDSLLATSDVADPDRATTATRWRIAAEGWRRAAEAVVEPGATDRARRHRARAERCDRSSSLPPGRLDEWQSGSYMTQLLVEHAP